MNGSSLVRTGLIPGIRRLRPSLRWPLGSASGNRSPAPTNDGLEVLVLPGFQCEADLADVYFRMLWYLNPLAKHLARISIAAPFRRLPASQPPAFFDPTLLRFKPRLDPKIDFFGEDDAEEWKERIRAADIVVRWREKMIGVDPHIAPLLRGAAQEKKIWRVDPSSERFEGSFYLYMSQDANPEREADLAECRRRFGELVRELGGQRKAYVFGTGPSLAEAFDFDFFDGLTIACNSMVTNSALLEHLQPRVFVAADPIFHAGCSSYAGEFRRHLLRALETYDADFLVPFRDYKLYSENLPPQWRKRIIGVPLDPQSPINVDLVHDFRVRSVGNVLTLLLIPLAATLSREVGILGCDGRLIEENEYFWKHEPRSQLGDKMSEIRRCHPAFFAIDYDEYYRSHVENVEAWLSVGEKAGVRFRNLTRSYVPALQRRSDLRPRERRARSTRRSERERRIALFDPGLKATGHSVGVARHLASIFAEVFPQVLLFDKERRIADRFNAHPANVEIIQLPRSLACAESDGTRRVLPDLHYHDVWKFIEDHEVDHVLLLYEGLWRQMYRNMPTVPYSVLVHVVWSILNSLQHPSIGPPVRRALHEARAIFVPENYMAPSLRPYARRVLTLPIRGFSTTVAAAPVPEESPHRDVLTVGTIGVVSANRNVDFLLDALGRYRGPALRYRLMGSPVDEAGRRVVRLASRLSPPEMVTMETRFEHLGDDEYEAALASLDYLLVAYDRDRELQTCAAMYSAVAHDTAVIAPRVRPFTVFAERYPGMFELYEPLDTDALNGLLARLATSPRRPRQDPLRLAEMARFRDDHSIQRQVEQVRELEGIVF